MVRYIEFGNIFKLQGINSYAHGCNCAGAMGKGIAVQFKKKFPKMYAEYKKLCHQGEFSLGDVFEYNYGDGYVFNLGTQATWKTKANIHAIEQSLTKMLLLASSKNVKKIALPKIAAGLGGLNWDSVKSVINKVATNHPDIELLVVENYNDD
jgi:O-acetyl-ADP-ribose deacetylase (regulator of RNase III)